MAVQRGSNITFLLLGVLAIFGWAYIFLFSDTFVIKKIKAEGINNLDQMDVSREVLDILDKRPQWRPWPSRHAWFIDRQSLEKELKKRFFAISVTVDKSLFNILRLKIEERSNKAIFHSHQQYGWVDMQGSIISLLNSEERKNAQGRILGSATTTSNAPPLIHRDLDDLIAPGYRVAGTDELRSWIESIATITDSGLSYREYEPPNASTTAAVMTSAEGYHVILDAFAPLDPQLKTYAAFIQSKPRDVGNVEYIDVRVPGRVYIK
jgi:hypothetical protein